MAQKILKVGSSLAVTIPADIVKKLKLSTKDRINVQMNEESGKLIITPLTSMTEHDKEIERRTLRFIDKYRSDLEALADK